MNLLRRPDWVLAGAIAGALLYMAAALASGLDRAAINHPGLVRLVPEGLRAESTQLLAAQALAKGQLTEASLRASAAIDAAPADRRGLGLFAASQLLGGDADGAGQAFAVARRAGMRDPLTLAYGISTALEGGDYAVAARELEALLRTNPQLPQSDMLLAAMVSAPEGRRALAQRLERDPVWARSSFVHAPDTMARLLSDRAAFAQPLGCDTVRPVVDRLLASEKHGFATAVWRGHCPGTERGGLVGDPDFAALTSGDRSEPFGWRRVPSGDINVTLSDKGGVMISNRSAVSRRVLQQPVDLAPGQYRAKLSGSAEGLEVLLRCASDRGTVEARRRSIDGVISVERGCDGQVLSVWVAPGTSNAEVEQLTLNSF